MIPRVLGHRGGRRFIAIAVGPVMLFVLVAVWVTWPLSIQLSTCLPLGSEREPTVPLFNLWTLWWNVDRVENFYSDYWRAPIFYPAQDAFVYSEPQPLSGLAGWALWRVLPSLECVYNVLLLGHLALNGWTFCWLLRSWRIGWPTALSAGLMVECLPMVHWQLGVVQLVPLWGVIGTLRFLHQFMRSPSATAAVGLGFFGAATYLLCSYHGLMLSILLIVSTPVLCTKQKSWPRTCLLSSLSLALFLIGVLPVVAMQWRATRRYDMVPPREVVEHLSGAPQHYLQTPWRQLVVPPGAPAVTRESPWALSPGTFKLVFAGLGLGWGITQKKRRRLVGFSLVFLLTAGVLSMGPAARIGGWSPYQFMSDVPGYAQMRNIYRFAVFVQLMTVVLAAIGLDALWRLLHLLIHKRFARRLAGKALHWISWSVVASLLLVEVIPAAPRLHCLGNVTVPRWVSWLRESSHPDDVLAAFPFPTDESLEEYEATTTYMYWQTRHARRMINGYSGFFPPQVIARESRMLRFPQVDCLKELASTGVNLLVVHGPLNADLQETIASKPFANSSSFSVERILWDSDSRVGIYRIRQP